MSLDVRLLEKVREVGGGIVQARCPACAEGGSDRAGEHLRLHPDGRFGCCVHPKDREHRRRIFALAGDKAPRSFTVKVAGRKPVAEPARSVTAALTGYRGTLGTAISESVSVEETTGTNLGTLGTPILNPHTCVREDERSMHGHTHTYKDFESGVPSVPNPPVEERRDPVEAMGADSRPRPHLSPSGLLVIPFASDPRYHWWKDGQDPAVTRAEVESWLAAAKGKETHGAHV